MTGEIQGRRRKVFACKKFMAAYISPLYFVRPVRQKVPCREPSEAGMTGAEEDAHTPERKAPGGELRFRSEELRQVYRRCGERAGASQLQGLTLAIRP